MEKNNCDSVISVTDVEGHHPARMKYVEDGKIFDPPFCEDYENQPRQELTPMYIRNGGIYLTKRNIILNNSFKGNNSRALIMDFKNSVNIDSIYDFKLAELIMKENNNFR